MKVIYLSSTQLRKDMFALLKQQEPDIVFSNTDNEKIKDFSKWIMT